MSMTAITDTLTKQNLDDLREACRQVAESWKYEDEVETDATDLEASVLTLAQAMMDEEVNPPEFDGLVVGVNESGPRGLPVFHYWPVNGQQACADGGDLSDVFGTLILPVFIPKDPAAWQ